MTIACNSCVISVAAETRYCTVSVSSGPQHIVDFGRTRQQSETLGSSSSSRCGDESRPWTVEALNGQRISVSLIDFTTANTNTTAGRLHDMISVFSKTRKYLQVHSSKVTVLMDLLRRIAQDFINS